MRFSLIVLIVAGVVAELLLRLFMTNQYLGDETFVQLVRIPGPNRHYQVNRRFIYPDDPLSVLRSDERSYWLPSRRFAEPDATIVFFGASTTLNAAVDEDLRFPAVVSYELEEEGLRVNTLNVAMAGNTLHDSLNSLLNHVVLDRPDIAVVMHASADVGILVKSSEYGARMAYPLGLKTLRRWLHRKLSAWSWMYSGVRYSVATLDGMAKIPLTDKMYLAKKARPDTFAEDPFRQRLEAYGAMCRSFGITPVFMTQPYSNFTELTPAWQTDLAQDRANDVIREVGREKGILVIDLVKYLHESVPDFDEPMQVFYDGIHATNYGSRILGEYIAEILHQSLPLLQAPRSSGAAAARD